MATQPNQMWARLHQAIIDRGDDLGWTKAELTGAIDVSDKTLDRMGDGVALQRSVAAKLRSIEKGLGWGHGVANQILAGGSIPEFRPDGPDDEPEPPAAAIPLTKAAASGMADLPPEDQQVVADLIESLRRRNGIEP